MTADDMSMLDNCLQAIRQQAFYNTYWKTFNVLRADTDELKEKAFQLRYQIYCTENLFIEPAEHPGEIERDAYDPRAAHHLLIHRATGDVVGTIRVLLPHDTQPLRSFELQKVCDHPLLQLENRINELCEISRFCMASRFRRRPNDGRLLPAYYEQEWTEGESRLPALGLFRRRIPYAPLGLLMAAFETVLQNGVTTCVTALESKQFHTMRRMGFTYQVLGPRIEHQGVQQPLLFNIKAVLDSMASANPECWDVISDKGRLHRRATDLYQADWQDSLFDDIGRDMMARKLL